MFVAIIQMNIAWEDPAHNLAQAEILVAQAASHGARLVCLPELFATGVTLNTETFASAYDGPIPKALSKMARDHGVYLLGAYIREAHGGLPFNCAILFAPDGKPVAEYRKNHVFSYADEHTAYANGSGLALAPVDAIPASFFICYDLRFPDIFRIAVHRGAQLLIVQANWPRPRQAIWQTLLRARAIENQSYVIGVNRVGSDPKHSYFGGSLVIDPEGAILAKAGDQPAVLIAELDPDLPTRVRARFPALQDRREGYYDQLRHPSVILAPKPSQQG